MHSDKQASVPVGWDKITHPDKFYDVIQSNNMALLQLFIFCTLHCAHAQYIGMLIIPHVQELEEVRHQRGHNSCAHAPANIPKPKHVIQVTEELQRSVCNRFDHSEVI